MKGHNEDPSWAGLECITIAESWFASGTSGLCHPDDPIAQ